MSSSSPISYAVTRPRNAFAMWLANPAKEPSSRGGAAGFGDPDAQAGVPSMSRSTFVPRGRLAKKRR